MERKLACLLVVSAIFFLLPAMQGLAEEGPAPPSARQIPGINAVDYFTQGCVDCHVVREYMERDVRISAILKEWSDGVPEKFLKMAQDVAPEGMELQGVHPAVGEMIEEIPAGCFACHGKSSKTAPALGRMMHLYHLKGGDENHYMTVFKGECTHCHKLNQATGEWSMPSGKEK